MVKQIERILLGLLLFVMMMQLSGCKSVDSLIEKGKYIEAYQLAKTEDQKEKIESIIYENNLYADLFNVIDTAKKEKYINKLIGDKNFVAAYKFSNNDSERNKIVNEIIDSSEYKMKSHFNDDAEKELYERVANELVNKNLTSQATILYCKLGLEDTKYDIISSCIESIISGENKLSNTELGQIRSTISNKDLKDKLNIYSYDDCYNNGNWEECYKISQDISDTNYESWAIAKMVENGIFKSIKDGKGDDSRKYNVYVDKVYYTIRWSAKQKNAESLSKIKDKKKDYINSLSKVFNYLYNSEYDDDFKKERIGTWYRRGEEVDRLFFYRSYKSFFTGDFITATFGENATMRTIDPSHNYGYEKYTKDKPYWINDRLICFYIDTSGYANENLYKEAKSMVLSSGLNSYNDGIANALLMFGKYNYSEDIDWNITTREGKSINVLDAVKIALIEDVEAGKI